MLVGLRVLFMLVATPAFATAVPPATPTPLCPSVLLLDERRYEAAEQLVERAATPGAGRLQLVVTVHARLTPELRLVEFGLLRDRGRSWARSDNFLPINGEVIDWLSDRLSTALRRANALGLDVAVLPHLDAAGTIQEWRNEFDFSPNERHGGQSYFSAVIAPIAESIASGCGDEQRVWLALSGEMGRSLFSHPLDYLKMMADLRAQLPQNRVMLGVSLSHSQIGGGCSPSSHQRDGLQTFLDSCDFIGMSEYRPFAPPASPVMFAKSQAAFLTEFRQHGLSIHPAMPFHLSEVGLGGGPGPAGSETPAAAAEAPWEGVGVGSRNPWATHEMRAFRHRYYAALLDYLDGKGLATNYQQSANTPARPVCKTPEAAFLWSEGSWDSLGADDLRFADPEIAKLIQRHNESAGKATTSAR